MCSEECEYLNHQPPVSQWRVFVYLPLSAPPQSKKVTKTVPYSNRNAKWPAAAARRQLPKTNMVCFLIMITFRSPSIRPVVLRLRPETAPHNFVECSWIRQLCCLVCFKSLTNTRSSTIAAIICPFMILTNSSPNLQSPHTKRSTIKGKYYRRYTGVFVPLSFLRPVLYCWRLDGELIRARVTLIQRGTSCQPPEEHPL